MNDDDARSTITVSSFSCDDHTTPDWLVYNNHSGYGYGYGDDDDDDDDTHDEEKQQRHAGLHGRPASEHIVVSDGFVIVDDLKDIDSKPPPDPVSRPQPPPQPQRPEPQQPPQTLPAPPEPGVLRVFVPQTRESLKRSLATKERKTAKKQDVEARRWPHNVKNSCYLDSTLVALLSPDNVLLSTYLLHRTLTVPNTHTQRIFSKNANRDLVQRRRVQTALRKLAARLKSSKVSPSTDSTQLVASVREMLSKGKFVSTFSHGRREDAGEAVGQVLETLQLHTGVNNTISELVVGSNDLLSSTDAVLSTGEITTKRTVSTGLVWSVTRPPDHHADFNDILRSVEDSILQSPYRARDTEYIRRVQMVDFTPSGSFIIHVDRARVGDVALPMRLTVTINGRVFALLSVVMYRHGHYTALVRMGPVSLATSSDPRKNGDAELEASIGEWSFYNDTSRPAMRPATTLDGLKTRGLLYVYSS